MKTTDEIMGLVDRAYHLGQAYRQQADSDSWSENKKSEATVAKWLATKDEIRAALTGSMGWQGIDDHPTTEHEPFLILRPGNSVCGALVQQVSMFQGDMYPDELDANVDWNDRITDAIAWMRSPAPLPTPKAEGDKS